MTKQKINVLIGVPVAVSAENRTIESIYNLSIPDNVETSLRIVEGYTVDVARNKIVDIALQECADYILFVDSDVILPKDTLVRLLDINSDIATGWYIKKMDGEGVSELFNPVSGSKTLGNILESNIPKGGIFDVAACGFGCTLVKTSICRTIKDKKQICFEYIHTATGMCSEDIDFCNKATSLGYSIKFDAALRCGHIGKRIW